MTRSARPRSPADDRTGTLDPARPSTENDDPSTGARPKPRVRRCVGAVLVVLGAVATGEAAANGLSIPEPLVFDLVRPLGAVKGEREINALAVRPLNGRGPWDWAPELEYAFADGHAVEFELPFEDGRLMQYKVGLQGTFQTDVGRGWIHAWQYLGVYDRTDRQTIHSLLYVAGYRFDERWSALGMIGARRDGLRQPDGHSLLVNTSVFYNFTPTTLAGLEINLSHGQQQSWRVIPQVHHRFGQGLSVQAGAGVQRGGPVAAVRVIQEF